MRNWFFCWLLGLGKMNSNFFYSDFSRFSAIDILHSKWSGELTFEEFWIVFCVDSWALATPSLGSWKRGMSHVTWMSVHECDMIDSLIRVTWRHGGHRVLVRGNESCHTYEEPCYNYGWVMSGVWWSHVIVMNELCHLGSWKWVVSHVWRAML